MILPIAEEICIGEQTVIFLSDVIDVSDYLFEGVDQFGI